MFGVSPRVFTIPNATIKESNHIHGDNKDGSLADCGKSRPYMSEKRQDPVAKSTKEPSGLHLNNKDAQQLHSAKRGYGESGSGEERGKHADDKVCVCVYKAVRLAKCRKVVMGFVV